MRGPSMHDFLGDKIAVPPKNPPLRGVKRKGALVFCTRAPFVVLPPVSSEVRYRLLRDSPLGLEPLDCRAACCCGADWWLARGAAAGALRCARGAGCDRIAWLCERAAVLVRGAACDARALFCTRAALLLRDTPALRCARVW